jgi:hypothetical protein
MMRHPQNLRVHSFPSWLYCSQSGLILSVGGLTESLVRQSGHAFIIYVFGLEGMSPLPCRQVVRLHRAIPLR